MAFRLFADALSNNIDFYQPFVALLKNRSIDPYVADKAAYLLTSLMAHSPGYFQMTDLDEVCSILTGVGASKCTEIGVLDAICNLLKLDIYTTAVLSKVEVPERIFRVKKDDPAPKVYKSIFCCWLVSFDDSLVTSLKLHNVIEHTKGILMTSRAEKVIRVCLSFLKNALDCKALCEDIVEKEILEMVQSLEFEKWRDAELYDEIREVCQKISKEVNFLSSFDRYERELQTGQLTWGFIHSDKFWSENIMKFDTNQFSAVKKLAALLSITSPTTLAVACHDLGEFVQLHPLGKMKAAELNVKDKVMELMAHVDRDVQRESLLCCQKLMLNKWQDLPSAQVS